MANKHSRVGRTVTKNIEGHCSVVIHINNGCSIRVNAVECVCIILEIQGDEIAAHRGQVDVWNGEGFVCPCVAVAICTGVTGVAEPVRIVVEDRVLASRFIVNDTLWISAFSVSITVRSAFKVFFTQSVWCTTVHVGGRG